MQIRNLSRQKTTACNPYLQPGCFALRFGIQTTAQNTLKPAAQPAFHKVAENLYRLESSGGYYALIKKSGKQFRRSLKTKDRKAGCLVRRLHPVCPHHRSFALVLTIPRRNHSAGSRIYLGENNGFNVATRGGRNCGLLFGRHLRLLAGAGATLSDACRFNPHCSGRDFQVFFI
jgi:hypothetical protein